MQNKLKNIESLFKKSPYKCLKYSSFFASYEHLFSKYVGEKIIFVEIGVLNGGSLFMWRDYFGPQARIIGVDLNPEAKKWEKDGFEIFIGDQADEKFWGDFIAKVGGIDIILDDGGHTYDQQIITIECLLQAMNDEGIIVIEDTQTSYMNGFGLRKFSFINYCKKKIDQISFRSSNIRKTHKMEKRFWSIEFFDGMVAFRIKHSESRLKSEIVTNKGIDNRAIDYRYKNIKAHSLIFRIKNKFKFLKKIFLIKLLYQLVIHFITSRNSLSKKYFK